MDHSSCFALIVNSDNKILLLLRDDIPTIPHPNAWSLIGGSAEKGETPLQTVIREIKEEVNLEIADSRLTFIMKRPKKIMPDKFTYLYFVRISKDEENEIKIGDEGQRVEFFSLEEITELKMPPTVESEFRKYSKHLKQLLESTA